MPLSKGRTLSLLRKPAKSCSTTKKSCWRTATVGKRRSPTTCRSTRRIGKRGQTGRDRGRGQARSMIIQTLAFYMFAIITVAAGAMVISARNPVHSVLFLILAFFSSAGLFVLLGAEFLAMILVVVYVGAVAVLFLFVVMMLDIDFVKLKAGFAQYLPIGALVGGILAVEMVLVSLAVAGQG